MKRQTQELLQHSVTWLKEAVFPLWTSQGIDPENGGFFEGLTTEAKPSKTSRRAMVQARQIYSFAEGLRMELITADTARRILKNSTEFLISKYSLPSGGFAHAVTNEGAPENPATELYTQAFALFGLAQSYGVLKETQLKTRALELLKYLRAERQNPAGGFTEIKNGERLYQSNPHMHLFEAALAWAHVDNDPGAPWKDLCTEIFELCQTRFIQPTSGILCEHFDENWRPLQEQGRFLFEPGHHYEWAWLMCQYEVVCGKQVGSLPLQLFELAEKHGIRRDETGLAMDEIWSDFTVKKSSSRFWPQSERVKAAVELGLRAPASEQPRFAAAADQAMKALWLFLDVPAKGLWQDTRLEDGQFTSQIPKASSLYHIINAISEYRLKRPRLLDEGR